MDVIRIFDCMNHIWSGKRDSNSRPRPWQGRALPTELFPHLGGVIWSGKRDSNSRPRPWQGRALPTELFPQRFHYFGALHPKAGAHFTKIHCGRKLFYEISPNLLGFYTLKTCFR
jgi:hypothetical protein